MSSILKLTKKMILALVLVVVVLAIATYLFMQQPSFGKLPSGERKERIKKSQQYQLGIFNNLEKTTLLAEGVSYLGMTIEYFSKGLNREPADTIPSVRTDLKSLPDKPLLIWFGHSSYLLHLDGKNILVDPVFSDRPSPVQYVGKGSYPGTNVYTAEDFPPLDAIIISHDHYDHLDYHSIVKLREKTREFYVPLGVGEHLEHWGVDPKVIHEMDWWDKKELPGGMQLIATPARHFSGRGLVNNKTLWSSFVLISDSHRLFIGGDSGYDAAFKQIGMTYGPFDMVMIETGQYDKKWPSIHMMPEESVQACIDLRGKVFLPVHWGRFTLALHPWNEPVERALAEAEAKGVQITTPKIGEVVALDSAHTTSRWWKEIP
jgi:L-ascorbate metabolism protein UlaG (beta-lactamase superfamily)